MALTDLWDSINSTMDPYFGGIQGVSSGTAALIWFVLLVLMVIGTIIYLPLKRRLAMQIELEEAWPDVLAGLAESLRAGMSVEMAIDAVASQRDDRMGTMLREMVANMEEKSFTGALKEFAERSRSGMIRRVVGIINVALVSSGSFSETLENLSEEFWEIYLLRKERTAKTSGTANFILWGGALICPMLLGLIVAVFGSGEAGGIKLDIDLSILNQALVFYMLVLGAAGVLMQSVIMQTTRTAILRIPIYQFIAYTTLLLALKISIT